MMKKTITWILLLSLIVGPLMTALPISAAEADSLPKAPIALNYRLDEIGGGMADGIVTVTLPEGHRAEDIYLFWGDNNGKLPGYTALSPFKVSGNVVTHRMSSGSVVPQGATRLLAYTYSDTNGMSDACASYDLPEGAAMSDELLGTLLFEFQSLSDIHITTTVQDRLHHSDHMRAMLEDIIAVSPNSMGIFNNGDTVNNAKDEDYQEFLSIYNSYEDAPVMYSLFGNHELFRYGLPPTNDKFEDMKQVYWDFLSASVPEDAVFSTGTRFGSLSYSFERNGCKFICLGTDVLDQNNLTLSNNTIAWLEGELKDGQGNPIFVIMHQPMSGTLAGTFKNGYGVTANTTTALKALLANYPEVIMFNGHTHRDLNQYGIHYVRDEKLPSIFGTSSVGYLARAYDKISTETYKGSEGYYVYVYEDKVLVRGRDFLKKEWVSSAQFLVDLSEEALEKTPKKEVEAPLYGATATLSVDKNRLSGTVQCHLPVNNNASAIALFFSSADTGIIGDAPFATLEVDSKDTYFTCDISFGDVAMPYTADYILIYSYSDTLGWSADCDIIDLGTYIKGGGDPDTGNFVMNKYSFIQGEPILVTGMKNIDTSWIGIRNIASSDYRTWNYWKIKDVGIGTAVDITKDHAAFGRDYTELTPGVYEIGWMEASGGGFLENKTPENTTTFVIQSAGNISSGGKIKTNKFVYRPGEPIYVTALDGTDNDWIGMQVSGVNSGTALWYHLRVSGINKAFDITDPSNFTGIVGKDHRFGELKPGVYQLAWIAADKDRFQTGKTANETISVIIADMSDPLDIGVPTGYGVTIPKTAALYESLAEAAVLKQEMYTEASWQALLAAVEAGALVKNNPTHTQAEIDAAHRAIADAIAALALKSDDPITPPNPPQTETDPPQTETNPPVTTEEAPTTTDAPESEEAPVPPASNEEPTGEEPSQEEKTGGCGATVGWMPVCAMLLLAPVVCGRKKENFN